MEEIEGSIHVMRLDTSTAPEPWVYDVAFVPYGRSGGSLPVREVKGDDELRKLLRNGVGACPRPRPWSPSPRSRFLTTPGSARRFNAEREHTTTPTVRTSDLSYMDEDVS